MQLNILRYLTLGTLALNLNAIQMYTVDELILKSLKNSPNLQRSTSNYKAAQSRYNIAYSDYLPSVDLHVSVGKVGMNDIKSVSNDMRSDNLLLGKLSASEILYDFGKTDANVESKRFDSDLFLMQNREDISDKKRDVKEAYYNVLNNIALINVQKENVKLNDAQLYRAQKYFKAGIRTKIDVSDAKVSLIQAKLGLKKAQYNLKLAYANLDEVAGFTEIQQSYTVSFEALDLHSLFSSLVSYDLDLKESITFAYKHRAALKREEAQIKSSIAQEKQVSAEYYPTLYAAADYTKQKVEKFQGITPQNQWQASLNLDWNIYHGGATSAKSQESKINTLISNATLVEVALSIKKATTVAFINLYKSKDLVELSQALLKVSSEKFEQASKRYKYGLSDFIELQQARQGYIDAKASLIVDYYSYNIAVATLDNAIGK